ncbi:uncharacterized protein TNCV_2434251 [Trichonephila clavipes]|nr:uncharacterized protein TNCV_2434251 [Trichonephila clavipes]
MSQNSAETVPRSECSKKAQRKTRQPDKLYVSRVDIHSNKIKTNCAHEKESIGFQDHILMPHRRPSASCEDMEMCAAFQRDAFPDSQSSVTVMVDFSDFAGQFTCRNCGGGDRGRVAIYRPFGEVSLSLNRTVTCMVLKANDRRTSCPCHDEFRGPRSDYVRQWTDELRTTQKTGSGQRKVTSARDDRQLFHVTVNDRTTSSRQLAPRWSTATDGSSFNLWDHDGRISVRHYAGERCLPECVIERRSGLTPGVMAYLELSFSSIMHAHMLQRLFETSVQPNTCNSSLGLVIRRICRLLSTCGPTDPVYKLVLNKIAISNQRASREMTTSKQKVLCVLRFARTVSTITVQRAFRFKFSCQPPNENNILREYHQFETTSCLCKGKTKAVTGFAYLDAIQLWLFPQLEKSGPNNCIWKQDGAPPH